MGRRRVLEDATSVTVRIDRESLQHLEREAQRHAEALSAALRRIVREHRDFGAGAPRALPVERVETKG